MMAASIGKYAAKRMLGKQLKKYKNKDVAGDCDPYYAMVADNNGRLRKVKKQVPAYIPDHDAVILAKVRKRAYYLDMSLFNFFGIRFGWSSMIGLIPVVGDFLDLVMALRLVLLCRKVECGLGLWICGRMMINVLLDYLLGLVPLLGDLGDAAFKCNTKNVRLLEERLDDAYMSQAQKEEAKAREEANKRANPKANPTPASVLEDLSDDDDIEIQPRHEP